MLKGNFRRRITTNLKTWIRKYELFAIWTQNVGRIREKKR